MTNMDLTRRTFVVTTAAAGGGLLLGVGSASAAMINAQPWMTPTDKDGTAISIWISIDPEGVVTMQQAKQEMGQGTFTGLPQILAEEMHVDWSMVRVQYIDVNTQVRNDNQWGSMGTFGSISTRRSRVMLQQAGSSVRERLKSAAAAAWGVDVSQVAAKDSVLSSGNNRGTFAEFATAAAQIALAEEPEIKTPDMFTLMGTSVARLDTPLKVNGSASFSIDTRVPGMLYASVMSNPVSWQPLVSYDASAVMDRPGVVAVVELMPQDPDTPDWNQSRSGIRPGVAVVADTWYRAKTALDLMPIEFSSGTRGNVSTESIYASMYGVLDVPTFATETMPSTRGASAEEIAVLGGVPYLHRDPEGDALGVISASSNVLTADYHRPYQAHARMEPSGATVSVTASRVDAWVSSQSPNGHMGEIADITGIEVNDVYIHNNFLGGGYGGNGPAGAGVRTAAYIANEVGVPVKTIFPREVDLQQNYHRPATAVRLSAVLGDDGLPTAFFTRSVNSNLAHNQAGSRISDAPYLIPNRHHERAIVDASHINPIHHRAPGSTQNGFIIDSFVDEMALAGGWDPLEWRLNLVQHRPDWTLVLNTLKNSGAWMTDLPRGEGAGIGIIESHGTIVAAIAHVTVSRRGQLRVEKVTQAYDPGHVVNPKMCEAQIEGCIAWEMGHLITAEIYVQNGRITTNNFDTYQLSRMADHPEIEILAAFSGGEKWGGMGEPAAPPMGGAIANAIFFATGKRIRSTPIKNHDLSWS